MLKGFIHFIGSFLTYFFEEMADKGRLKRRSEPTIGTGNSPAIQDHDLPTIRLD